jgi:hypothetical protein
MSVIEARVKEIFLYVLRDKLAWSELDIVEE